MFTLHQINFKSRGSIAKRTFQKTFGTPKSVNGSRSNACLRIHISVPHSAHRVFSIINRQAYPLRSVPYNRVKSPPFPALGESPEDTFQKQNGKLISDILVDTSFQLWNGSSRATKTDLAKCATSTATSPVL